jgi:hypothetical protein
MAITISNLSNVVNEAIDFYKGGDAMRQYVQDKPLLNALISKQATIPSGYQYVSSPVTFADVGDETDSFDWYSNADQVAFPHPDNTLQAKYQWREVHAGMSVSETELTQDGIEVADSGSTSKITGREKTAISNLLDNKVKGMLEGWSRNFDEAIHRDGTQDAKAFGGLTLLVADDPSADTVGGLSAATYALWRNRALTGANKITASAANQTLTKKLRAEVRQLRRYGGRPNLIIAGSSFIEGLETELHEKGTYTQVGFANNGKTDIGLAGISMLGVGTVMYDPTLDDLSREKFCYILDTSKLGLTVLSGRDRVTRTPERPYDQYVLLKAMTWAGTMHCWQRNAQGVYEIA